MGSSPASSRSSPLATSWGRAATVRSSASSPPVCSATSRKGPSGRGVSSGSQLPQRTRTGFGKPAQKLRSRAVLPTPASPPSSTSLPSERRRTAANIDSSASMSAARSSSAEASPEAAVLTATAPPVEMPRNTRAPCPRISLPCVWLQQRPTGFKRGGLTTQRPGGTVIDPARCGHRFPAPDHFPARCEHRFPAQGHASPLVSARCRGADAATPRGETGARAGTHEQHRCSRADACVTPLESSLPRFRRCRRLHHDGGRAADRVRVRPCLRGRRSLHEASPRPHLGSGLTRGGGRCP